MNPQTLADDIAGERAKEAAIVAKRQATKFADNPEADAIAAYLAWVTARREQVVNNLNLSGYFCAPPGSTPVQHFTEPYEGLAAFDLQLVFHVETVKAGGVEQIRREYKGRVPGLPARERAATLEALAEELLAALRREETLIRAASANGLTIERRSSVPAAILVARDVARVTVEDLDLDLEGL